VCACCCRWPGAGSWSYFSQRAALTQTIVISEAHQDRLPTHVRCSAGDQFAIGPAELMDRYAALYPDFADMRRTALMHRPDMVAGGMANERLLALHLHYRNITWEPIELPIPMLRSGCDHAIGPAQSLMAEVRAPSAPTTSLDE
jgi:hypothetical protein